MLRDREEKDGGCRGANAGSGFGHLGTDMHLTER